MKRIRVKFFSGANLITVVRSPVKFVMDANGNRRVTYPRIMEAVDPITGRLKTIRLVPEKNTKYGAYYEEIYV